MELNQTQFFLLYISTMKKNGEKQFLHMFLESDLASFLKKEEYQDLLKNVPSYQNVWGKYADISNFLPYAYKNEILLPNRIGKSQISYIKLSKEKANEILACYPEEFLTKAQDLYEEVTELRKEKLIAMKVLKPGRKPKGKRIKK